MAKTPQEIKASRGRMLHGHREFEIVLRVFGKDELRVRRTSYNMPQAVAEFYAANEIFIESVVEHHNPSVGHIDGSPIQYKVRAFVIDRYYEGYVWAENAAVALEVAKHQGVRIFSIKDTDPEGPPAKPFKNSTMSVSRQGIFVDGKLVRKPGAKPQ